MSKRPTFNDLILDFGVATVYAAQSNDDDPQHMARQDAARASREALVRALRKAGIPLSQVAPQ